MYKVPMLGETLRGWGSADPDDLAVVLCAALRAAGAPSSVVFRTNEDGAVAAIEVRSGGRIVGTFPCAPMRVGKREADELAKAIKAAADVVGRPPDT